MAFIRKKQVKGKIYYQLVENYRDKDTGKIKQKVIKHLGTNPTQENEIERLKLENEKLRQELSDMYFDISKEPKHYSTAEKALKIWVKQSNGYFSDSFIARAIEVLNEHRIPTKTGKIWDKNRIKPLIEKILYPTKHQRKLEQQKIQRDRKKEGITYAYCSLSEDDVIDVKAEVIQNCLPSSK